MYISENFFSTVPDDNRQEKELKVYRDLEKLGIHYEALDHDRADTMEICEKIEEKLGAGICKNLFLCNRQETEFYLLMMPGKKGFKTKYLSKQINTARLSFADEKYMLEFLDITPGSVSVFGLANDKNKRVKLLIDKPLLEEESIGCHPCVNTSVVKIKVSDLLNVYLPYLEIEAETVDLPEPVENQ